ncbi:hypothetical protein [Nocardia sp. NRRL S-836]|uniref:hypothetical protein n=1 Tax=Nocardia sp. NRRL S-836 TaxID=1519492 RepID=UPI0012FAD2F6|nr:hypothetical protein [Nocardia sp. NRRL S-836]
MTAQEPPDPRVVDQLGLQPAHVEERHLEGNAVAFLQAAEPLQVTGGRVHRRDENPRADLRLVQALLERPDDLLAPGVVQRRPALELQCPADVLGPRVHAAVAAGAVDRAHALAVQGVHDEVEQVLGLLRLLCQLGPPRAHKRSSGPHAAPCADGLAVLRHTLWVRLVHPAKRTAAVPRCAGNRFAILAAGGAR